MDFKNCVMTDQYERIQGAKLKLQNKTVSVYKGVNTIGRNKTAIVNLKNLNVSQHHAVIIIVDDTQHFISDLNSSNGTYLLNTRLTPFKLYELSNEMEIKFGDEVASYLKNPNLGTTVHLEKETMEMTQNITQNFYAATTQLMFDNTSFNRSRLSSPPRESIPNKETQDIHEAATQVVSYPLKITNTIVEDSVLIEPIIDDIHEAPTQVVLFNPQPSTSRALRDATIQKNDEVNIHEIATQVVTFPQEKMCNSKKEGNEETRLVSPEITKTIHENTTPIAKSNSNKLNNGHYNSNDDSFTNNQNHENVDSSVIQDSIIEATVMDENEENVRPIPNEVISNGDSNSSMDFLTMQEPFEATQCNDNANVADDKTSTTSESLDIDQPRRRPPRKLSSSEDLLENQSKTKICNSDSETDIEDADNIENVKQKKLLKLSSESQTNNKASGSDSETDIEDDLPKINKKRRKIIHYDSETDIEDEVPHQSEDIVKPKVLSKKSILNSDSETEVEDNKEQDPVLEADEDADSNATEILNDTDCIPATQDAFADMFQYKNTKLSHLNHSENPSSEESFKLGLTELMNDGENNQSINEQTPTGEGNSVNEIQNSNSSNTGEKKIKDLFIASKQKSNDTVDSGKTDEDIYLMPTQKLKPSTTSTLAKDTEDMLRMMATQKIADDFRKLATASTSGIVTNEKDAEEDLYMMPTQQINRDVPSLATKPDSSPSTSKMTDNAEKEADEDIYMMPTQKYNESEHEFKAQAKKFSFKKKTTNLDGSLTNILNNKEEEDPYLKVTQKINETEDTNEDDIYMQPTQKLENNSQNTQKTQSNDDNDIKNTLYMQPTQDLNPAGPDASETRKDPTELLYMAPTQQMNQNSINALYMLDTQKIDTESNQQVEKDLYDLTTQPLSHALEATPKVLAPERQAEALSAKHSLVTNQDSPKRKRMKRSDLENLKKTIEAKEKIDDAETLSQIDAFVKKPLEKRETEDNDRVETLSQIDAFVKKPFENAPREEEISGKSKEDQINKTDENEVSIKKPSNTFLPKVKKHLPSKKSISAPINQKEEKELDRPETLSQIEAFIKKPLHVNVPKSKKISEFEEIPSSSGTKGSEIMQNDILAKYATKELEKPSEEDLYLASTQEITQDLLDDRNKSEESTKASRGMVEAKKPSTIELYMLETQQIDSQSDISKAARIPQNNKRSSPHVLGHEETIVSAKSSETIDLDIPKNKKMKQSDTEDLEKTVDSKNEAEDIERPETLSQIDAFIKKPLDVAPSKTRNLSIIEEKPSTRSGGKSDQIKEPEKSKDVHDFEKPETSSRVSRTRLSMKPLAKENKQEISKTSLKSGSANQMKPQPTEASAEKLEVRYLELDNNASTSSTDTDTIRSDVDQSFALLEAKSTKTRKSSRIISAGDIKVAAACKNRRSMTTSSMPDFSKREVIESKPTTRKSQKIAADHNIVMSAPEIRVVDSSRHIVAKRKSDSSDSDFLESEIPAKKSKVSMVRKSKRKASVAEDIDKASTTSEESNKEVSSKTSKASDAGKGEGKATVADDVDKPSASNKDSNREVSSKTPRASMATRGKAKAAVADDMDTASTTSEESIREVSSKTARARVATRGKIQVSVEDDIDKASTANEETNRQASSKTPRASVARKDKAKAIVADVIDIASTTSEESNTDVSSKTARASVATRGKAKTIADNIDKASTANEETNRQVSSKTPRASVARKDKVKSTVAGDIDIIVITSSEESNTVSSRASVARKGRGKSIVKDVDSMPTAREETNKEPATPSTSRARARLTMSKNSEDNRSESGSAQDPSTATPRRGRKNVPDDALLASPERSKRKQRPKVVFTMMDDPQLESLIRQLGGSVVDSVDACTVLVTEHVKRSQKLLSAVGQGKPICSPNWIRASKKANEFLDPWEFILTDKEAESKWNFSLKKSISKAADEKLLVNYSFQLLVSSATDVLKGAIESCGGKCITRNPPKSAEGFYVVVASPENKNKYSKIKKQNPDVIIVEPEAIFDGVLRQDLRLGRHLLT